MQNACEHVWRMSVMVQIRNMPVSLHRRLKSRAALAGMSLSEYLLEELRIAAERPTIEELRVRLSARTSEAVDESPADAVRAEREGR